MTSAWLFVVLCVAVIGSGRAADSGDGEHVALPDGGSDEMSQLQDSDGQLQDAPNQLSPVEHLTSVDHRLTKRNYPRWYQAYNYKTPTYGNWRNSPRAESKRFLPLHPLARFRGLTSSGSRPSSGGRSGIPSVGRSSGSRWESGNRGGIPAFSDMMVADMSRRPATADDEYEGDDEGRGGVSGLEESSYHTPQVDLEGVKAGELLKYLLAVNGNRNVGSSLRFGFTK